MAFLTATSNAFGTGWFDESWTAQSDQPTWKETLEFYVSLINDAGPDDRCDRSGRLLDTLRPGARGYIPVHFFFYDF